MKNKKREKIESKVLLIGILLILLVSIVGVIGYGGVVIAQEGGGVLGSEGDLVVELNNLTLDLVNSGYDWLVNYLE